MCGLSFMCRSYADINLFHGSLRLLILTVTSRQGNMYLQCTLHSVSECNYMCRSSEPPTNTDSSVFIRILKLITDEKLKNTDD